MCNHSLKSEEIKRLADLYMEEMGRNLHKDVQFCIISWPVSMIIKKEKSNEIDDQ